MRKHSVALAAILGAVGAFSTAIGQQVTHPAAVTGGEGNLDEIVVTAARREETLQKSSLAIQVLSADELKNLGVTDAKDLTLLVPGLQIGKAGPDTQIYIRGVGDFGGNALANPAVATSVDGVYIARPAAVAGQFYDLARIEVLKGPQGTLYGRNATGGAINIITTRPSFENTGGYVDIEGGNYGEINTDGAINLPINDRLALRAAFQLVKHNGYLSDNADDERQGSGRIEALWQPNEAVSWLLQADYSHFGGNGAGFAVRAPGIAAAVTPWLGTTDMRANTALLALAAGLCTPDDFLPPAVLVAVPPKGLGFPPKCAPGVTSLASPLTQASFQDNNIWGAHAEMNIDLGFANLTLIPAYRSTVLNYLTFPTFGDSAGPETSKEATFEVRLGQSSGPLKWVAGAFYLNEKQTTHNDVVVGLLQNQHSDENLRTSSVAAFSEATLSVNDSFRFIGGLRYTHDAKSLYGGQLFDVLPSLACADPTVPKCLSETFGGSQSFNKTTWKLGSEYDLTSKNMLYFTASTGFKAGGLNDSAGATIYKPENLLAFEFGARNRFLNDRLQVNIETFYWKYRDQQIPHVTTDMLGNIAFNYENAGRARQYGFDLDLTAKPTSRDVVRVAVEYLDSRYLQFSYLVPNIPGLAPVPGVTTGCSVTSANASAIVDCSGYQLLAAPQWAGSLAWDHIFDLSEGGRVIAHADAQFASARWLALDFLAPQERAPAYIVDTVTLTYQSEKGKWSVGGYVRNLTNRAVYTNGNQDPFVPGYVGATIAEPRTYGVRLGVTF
jgi:iron complex outermembrane recepter protein